MNRRDHRAVTEAEAREIRAIADHHDEEYKSGLDDVDGRYRLWDEDQDLDGVPA